MDFSMSAASVLCLIISLWLLNYYYVEWGKNRAIPPSFHAVTSTSGDIATPPLHFLWKNRLTCTCTIQTNYKIINHLIVKSFDDLKP